MTKLIVAVRNFSKASINQVLASHAHSEDVSGNGAEGYIDL